MKLLKMRSCIIGFIIAIISLFSFNNNANALELKNGDIVPDLPQLKSEFYSISYSKQYKNYVLIFYQEKYIKAVNGIENSYIQDNPNDNYLGSQFHNAIGGFCGLSNEPKVWFYYLENNEWKYKGYDCYGSDLPYIYEYDTSIENTGDSYFTLENVNSDFVKEYYNTYIQYSTVNIFKYFKNSPDGPFEQPILIYSTDMNVDTTNKMNLSSEYNCAADECFYSITAKLTQPLESTLNYEYSYDNETWHTLSAFSSSSNSFELKHYFNIPIYFRIRKLNTNEIIWSTLYEADFSEVNKHIIVSEKAGVEDGNEYIKTSFDFSEYFKYKNSGSYELKTFFDDNDIELFDDVWSTTIYKQGFDNFGNFKTNIKIKIDNKVVEELNYTLNEEDKEFDEIYDDILNDNLDQDLSNGDYSTVEGMINSIKSFITAISNFVSSFFGLIMGFFNALNIWIRSFIISIFVVIVICKLIKAVRK